MIGREIFFIETSDDVPINPGLLPNATYTDFAQSGKTIGGGNPSATIFVIIDLDVLFILTSKQRTSLCISRALLGGAFERPPPSGFSRIAKKRRRAAPPGFHPPYPPVFCATFVKISAQGHVRSGHQVRSSDPTTK